MKIKKLIKNIGSVVRHPLLGTWLLIRGAKALDLLPRISVNNLRYIKCGNKLFLGSDSRILFLDEYYGEKYSPSLEIGNNVSIGNRFSALCAAPINIKDNCLIASDVMISSENHGMAIEESDSYGDIPLVAKPVEIGKGCWIGEKVCILPGVTLGDRCIVAAGAVVTKSFETGCLIAGVPARVVKKYNFKEHIWERV